MRLNPSSLSLSFRLTLYLGALLILLQLTPENWHSLLRYERNSVAAGEIWRILTSNFIHLSWGHLALNLTGLLLIGCLFAARFSPWYWLTAVLVCSLSTGFGLYFLSPEVFWCVGLSGTLHGLIVVGTIDWIKQGDRLGIVLLIGIGAKLLWERLYGGSPLSVEITGGAIVTDAHIWGASGAIILFLISMIWTCVLSSRSSQV